VHKLKTELNIYISMHVCSRGGQTLNIRPSIWNSYQQRSKRGDTFETMCTSRWTPI